MAKSERIRMEIPNEFACKSNPLQWREPNSEGEFHYQLDTFNNNRLVLSSALILRHL